MLPSRCLCIPLSIIGVAACGGGGGSTPIDDLGTETAAAACAKWAVCCTPMEFMTKTLGAADEAECRTTYAGLIEALLLPTIRDSIDNGRLVYHADRMAACLDLYDSVTCVEFELASNGGATGPAGCEDPFEGQVADAGPCAQDFDCVSNYCSGDGRDPMGGIVFGACRARPGPGMMCDDTDECADGSYCDGTTTCQSKLADGAACTSDGQCVNGGCNGAPGVCGATTTCDGT